MAISAYVGLPGSGKSYGVFENVIVPALKEGRTVFTNIPFNEDAVIEACGSAPVAFDVADILENDRWFDDVFIPGAIFVCDEAWRVWKGGTRANQIPESHASFFAEHRHRVGEDGRSTEIVIVTQDLNQIASFVRNLVEFTYRAVKLSAIGADKKFRIDIFHGPVTGPNPPKRDVIRSIHGSYRPEIYKLYQSHTQSLTGEAGDETRADKRANIFKGYLFKTYPILVVVLGAFIVYGIVQVGRMYGFTEQSDVDNQALSVTDAQQVETTTQTVTRVIRDAKPDYLRDRRLTIVGNQGVRPTWDYVIEARSGNNVFRLRRSELLRLGYEIEPINDCLAVLRINQSSYTVTCRERSSDSLIDFKWSTGSHDS